MIIVFGSINMDLVLTPEHSPEAGETILMKDYQRFPGGKGANQAVAASRMGSETHFAGCLGQDGFAAELLQFVHSQGVKTTFSRQVSAPTGTAFIIVEPNGDNRIIVASAANLEARADQLNDEALRGHTVLMQMETDPAEVKAMALRAHGVAARVILNLAPALPVDAETLDHVDMLILNEIEICQLAKQLGRNANDDFEAAASSLANTHKMTCVITLGDKGAVAFGPDGTIAARSASLKLDRVVDTTGAGDAFCGAIAAGLDQGMALQPAMEFACAAGALACLKMGAMASYPTLDEVKAALAPAPLILKI